MVPVLVVPVVVVSVVPVVVVPVPVPVVVVSVPVVVVPANAFANLSIISCNFFSISSFLKSFKSPYFIKKSSSFIVSKSFFMSLALLLLIALSISLTASSTAFLVSSTFLVPNVFSATANNSAAFAEIKLALALSTFAIPSNKSVGNLEYFTLNPSLLSLLHFLTLAFNISSTDFSHAFLNSLFLALTYTLSNSSLAVLTFFASSTSSFNNNPIPIKTSLLNSKGDDNKSSHSNELYPSFIFFLW